MNQYDLLFTKPAPHNGVQTSYAAAQSISRNIAGLRRMVLEHITRQPMTCDAIEVVTGLAHQTASARVNELRNWGFICDSGRRELTRSGRKAIVWEAA